MSNKQTTNNLSLRKRRQLKIEALEIVAGEEISIREAIYFDESLIRTGYTEDEMDYLLDEISNICNSLSTRAKKLKNNDNRYNTK